MTNLTQARLWPKGRVFDQFEVGQVFDHHWGRTLNAGDNTLFCTLTLHFNPLYFNVEFARAHGHPDTPIAPLLVFNTVLGMSVEDLSEAGGPFLGINALEYLRPVYPGDTLFARSTTLTQRESQSRGDAGIVGWRTEGRNQRDEAVVVFERTNLISKTPFGASR